MSGFEPDSRMPGDRSITRQVLEYIEAQYGVQPDFLWENSPNNAAIRHPGSKKWFGALLMDMSGKTLGLPGVERLDILNVKCDPVLIASLRDDVCYLPGWHMNKTHWLSLRLDGVLPPEDIFPLIDLSWHLTGPKKRRQKT